MTPVQDTVPAQGQQASIEDITWGIDLSALLGTGQTVTNAVVTLTDLQGNAVVLPDIPTIGGSVLSQRIRAGALTASGLGSTYTLQVSFQPSTTTNVFVVRLVIEVPF